MLAYLGHFSASFIVTMIAWPFVSAVLTLPILAGMYHRHHQLRFSAVVAAYLAVLYLLGLVAFTLYPMPDNPQVYCETNQFAPQLSVMRFVRDIRTGGLDGLLQLVLNVVLFVPLGFVMARWLRWEGWVVIPAGFLVSLTIECSQLTGFWGLYPCAYRHFDVDDLMTNTLGAILGWALAWLLDRISPPEQIDRDEINVAPKLLHRAVTLVIDMCLVAVVYFCLAAAGIFLLHHAATPLPDGDYRLGGLTFGIAVFTVLARVVAVLAFLVFELWIPVTHYGQTLGGMFTHMTVETKWRHGKVRAAFYTLRSILLYALLQPGRNDDVLGTRSIKSAFDAGATRVSFAVALAMLLIWIVARQLPYDFIPGRPKRHEQTQSLR